MLIGHLSGFHRTGGPVPEAFPSNPIPQQHFQTSVLTFVVSTTPNAKSQCRTHLLRYAVPTCCTMLRTAYVPGLYRVTRENGQLGLSTYIWTLKLNESRRRSLPSAHQGTLATNMLLSAYLVRRCLTSLGHRSYRMSSRIRVYYCYYIPLAQPYCFRSGSDHSELLSVWHGTYCVFVCLNLFYIPQQGYFRA
jgi:hypothetical protein